MTAQQVANQVLTFRATAAITQKRAVTWTGVQAGAGVSIAGIADTNAAIGENYRLIVGTTAVAEAGAAIDGTETRLATDASGRMVPWASGIVAARLIPGQIAIGAGDMIEVFPIHN